MNRVYSSMCNVLGSPGSLSMMRMSLFKLYTPESAKFSILYSSGSTNEPFVYTYCCGLYLGVFMW